MSDLLSEPAVVDIRMPPEHATERLGAARMIQRTCRAPGDGAVRARICRTDGPAGQRAPPGSGPGAFLGASSGTAYVTAMWPIGRPPQWVGRTQELAILRAAAKSLRGGEGAVVWVEGEPGIGKSSLVAEALASASDPEWDIGWGMADQLTERLPLRVMLDCLQVRPGSPDPRRAQAADLLRSRRPGLFADGDASVTGVEVLVTLVDELCAAAPTVIVVDDLQWADEASLIVWHQLAASIGQLRLLLIGTCRPTPRRPGGAAGPYSRRAPWRRGGHAWAAARDGCDRPGDGDGRSAARGCAATADGPGRRQPAVRARAGRRLGARAGTADTAYCRGRPGRGAAAGLAGRRAD